MLVVNKTRGFLLVLLLASVLYIAFRNSAASRPQNVPPPKSKRLMKASMLYPPEQVNEIYERTLRTNDQHNELHGYEMHVLKRGITTGYWNKVQHLLALVLAELGKAPEERTEWIMWVDADVIILNPLINVEVFLPPQENQFDHLRFVGSRALNGDLNGAAFFIRVDPWTVQFLVKVMAIPWMIQSMKAPMFESAMEFVLNETQFRGAAVYQPRTWFHTMLTRDGFDGEAGSLLVKFDSGLQGNRWRGLTDWLNDIEARPTKWHKEYLATSYEEQIGLFWARIRAARKLLRQAEQLTFEDRGGGEFFFREISDELRGAMLWMKEILWFRPEDAELLSRASQRLSGAIAVESSARSQGVEIPT